MLTSTKWTLEIKEIEDGYWVALFEKDAKKNGYLGVGTGNTPMRGLEVALTMLLNKVKEEN